MTTILAGQPEDGVAAAIGTVRTVHLIFKTHLDIGFTALAREVRERYFSQYIPRAIDLARRLREAGEPERFIWTTGSWLICEYLEQATPDERRRLEQAIAAGDLVWHALPFTVHSELIDPSLFRAGLRISQELDRRYGRHTIAAKMTDVPGHTRGIVPLLAQAGIRFLHIGVNPACAAPDVPPVFIWRDPGGAEIVVMYDKGTYGGTRVVPGLDEAIMFAHTGDNLGPQTPEQVRAVFRMARERFPHARVIASTLDAYAHALVAAELELPAITAEIGDTWIHGVGSDPGKVARYRELCRLRRHWLEGGHAIPDRFNRALLLVAEHTWGLDEKTQLGDDRRYARDEFRAARAEPRFRALEASWAEQRAYVDQAVAALGDSPFAAEARAALQELMPRRATPDGYIPIADPAAAIETAHFALRLDPRTGALIGLLDRPTGRAWATPAQPLALLSYQTFGRQDYDRFWRQYVVGKRDPEIRWWARQDLNKLGIAAASARQATYNPVLRQAWWRQDTSATHLRLELDAGMDDATAYGCPRVFTLDYTLPRAAPTILLTVQWFDKEAMRLPEALWLTFCPAVPDPRGWRLEKMGQRLAPGDVVRNGNRTLHAVDAAVYRGAAGTLRIETLDAPLLAPGQPSLLQFTNRQPSLRHGLHINLYNNVWGTNFPMWYEDDARFRFVLAFDATAPRAQAINTITQM